jgi:tetratricopeptide (TPR) repeat protein
MVVSNLVKGWWVVSLFALVAFAERILVYDEEKGIIFVDKDSLTLAKQKGREKPPVAEKPASPAAPREQKPDPQKLTRAKSPADIHQNRSKDPPEFYFKSGLEYYKNDDFENALKNFAFAVDQDIKPEYLLWMGKTYRQIDKPAQMFRIMERILKDHPESPVADDALFEIAFFYQKSDDYEKATETYKQLIEQYPFGVSFSNGDEFLDIARQQMRSMRGEMVTALKVLGIEGDDLSDSYLQFQKDHTLPLTGRGDKETVAAIKKFYQEKLANDETQQESQMLIRKSGVWVLASVAVFVLNCVAVATIRVKISQNLRQIELLRGLVADLQRGS